MGIKLQRKKPGNLLTSVIYRLSKVLPLSNERKFRLYLDLEWIFDRLSHETSFRIYEPHKHPVRVYSREFLLKHISGNFNVLDLGCNRGDISYVVAEKAKKVVGIDYAAGAIETAKKLYQRENLEFHHAEALEYLQQSPDKFDVLILSHILEHLDQPQEFLMKFKNNFEYIYIEVPDFERYYLNHYRSDMGMKLVYSDDDHVSEFDRREIRALLRECKIDLLEEEHIFGVQKFWCRVNHS